MTKESHERGSGAPSSLESAHHVNQRGEVVYSKAQQSALKNAKAIGDVHEERRTSAVEVRPAFLDYVHQPEPARPAPVEEPVPVVQELEASSEETREEPAPAPEEETAPVHTKEEVDETALEAFKKFDNR